HEAPLHDLAQLDPGVVAEVQHAVRVGVRVLDAADLEGVQMAVHPTHAELDDVVQPGQRTVLHLDATPDRGTDVLEGYLQLEDRPRSFAGGHRPSPLLALHALDRRPQIPTTGGRSGAPARKLQE